MKLFCCCKYVTDSNVFFGKCCSPGVFMILSMHHTCCASFCMTCSWNLTPVLVIQWKFAALEYISQTHFFTEEIVLSFSPHVIIFKHNITVHAFICNARFNAWLSARLTYFAFWISWDNSILLKSPEVNFVTTYRYLLSKVESTYFLS